MNKSFKRQMDKVREVESVVLMWELLSRRKSGAFLLVDDNNKNLLYVNENGVWCMKGLGDED